MPAAGLAAGIFVITVPLSRGVLTVKCSELPLETAVRRRLRLCIRMGGAPHIGETPVCILASGGCCRVEDALGVAVHL